MTEESSWQELQRHAAGRLPAGFSAQVLHQAVRDRRRRRGFISASLTLALCLSVTGALTGWQVYREHETNLAQWQELAAVSTSLENTL